MASMEDLVATISGGMHVGQQHDDLKELHAKLAQTLHPTKAPFRPIPPPATALSPGTQSGGPIPPPAPASSWNDNAVPLANNTNAWGGMGNSPRQGGFGGSGKRETGFSVPAPKPSAPETNSAMPYHASVLPIRASPKDTGGFGDDDAFKPLWEEKGGEQWSGFKDGR